METTGIAEEKKKALLVRTLEMRERERPGRPAGRARRPRRGAVAPRARGSPAGGRSSLLLILLPASFSAGPDPAPAGGTERNGAAGPPPRHQQLALARCGEKSDTPMAGETRRVELRSPQPPPLKTPTPPPSPPRRKSPPSLPACRPIEQVSARGKGAGGGIGRGKEAVGLAVGAGLIRPALHSTRSRTR